jgi:hypothetical protein
MFTGCEEPELTGGAGAMEVGTGYFSGVVLIITPGDGRGGLYTNSFGYRSFARYTIHLRYFFRRTISRIAPPISSKVLGLIPAIVVGAGWTEY